MANTIAAGTEKYKKHTHREHILELPDTYVGSIETATRGRWIYDASIGKMTWKNVAFNPGLYKIFDEIIVNARDAFIRGGSDGRIPIKHIDVKIQTATGTGTEEVATNVPIIRVENDGDGIPIEMHETEKVYIPEIS